MAFRAKSNIDPIYPDRLLPPTTNLLYSSQAMDFYASLTLLRPHTLSGISSSPLSSFRPPKTPFIPSRASSNRLFLQHPLCSHIYVDCIISSTESCDYIHTPYPSHFCCYSNFSVPDYMFNKCLLRRIPVREEGLTANQQIYGIWLTLKIAMPVTMKVGNWGYKKTFVTFVTTLKELMIQLRRKLLHNALTQQLSIKFLE